MATWAEVVDFSQLLIAKPSNAPEETATPMRWAPVLHLDANGKRVMTSMRWAFSKVDKARGFEYPEHMHARDDKLLESKLWRPHFEARRGLLIVTSFNEGQDVPTFKSDRVTPTGNTKTIQWTIRPKDGSRLAIAVIYRESQTPKGPVLEFVQVTTPANEGIAKFVVPDPDQRMPAVMAEADIPVWLGEVPATLEEVHKTLKTYEDGGAWDMRPEKTAKQVSPKPKSRPTDDLF